jgi:hypothetical protein
MSATAGLNDAKVAVHGASAFFDAVDVFSNEAAQQLLVKVMLPWATEVATHGARKWNSVGQACSMCMQANANSGSAVADCLACHEPVCLRHAFVAHDSSTVCWECVRRGAQATTRRPKGRRKKSQPGPGRQDGTYQPPAGGGFDQFKWAYALLNVDPTSSDEAVRAAYKKACYDTHPDRAKDPQDAKMRAEKFKLVQQALQTIKSQRGNL